MDVMVALGIYAGEAIGLVALWIGLCGIGRWYASRHPRQPATPPVELSAARRAQLDALAWDHERRMSDRTPPVPVRGRVVRLADLHDRQQLQEQYDAASSDPRRS